MGRLFIFGNGLDLHYSLKTSTKDYVDILRTKQVYNETGCAADVFEEYGVLWSKFEEDIAHIDLESIRDSQLAYPDYLSDHEYDRDGVITNVEYYVDSLRNAIFESLEEMVSQAESDIRYLPGDLTWNFKEGDLILSFNYTSTIEKVSNASAVPIIHIHGLYRNSEQLIFGYDKPCTEFNYRQFSEPDDGDYYLEQQLYLINDFYMSLRKNLQMDRLNNFLKTAGTIDEVFVYGHSLGDVDVPYLEMIEKELSPRKWYVSFHDQNSPVLYEYLKLSFNRKIELFQW